MCEDVCICGRGDVMSVRPSLSFAGCQAASSSLRVTTLHISLYHVRIIYLCYRCRHFLPDLQVASTARLFLLRQRKMFSWVLHLAITMEGYLASTLQCVSISVSLSLVLAPYPLHRTHSLAHFLPICFHRGYVLTRTSATARRSTLSCVHVTFSDKTLLQSYGKICITKLVTSIQPRTSCIF